MATTQEVPFLGPQEDVSKIPDYRLRDSIEYPYGSYEQTMASWGNGWERDYVTSVEVDYMVAFAADTFRHFGGGGKDGQLSLSAANPVSYEEVLAYVSDPENQARFGVWAFEDPIAKVAHKYLIGEGEDYEAFASM